MTFGVLVEEEMDGKELKALNLNLLYDYDYKNPETLPYTDYAHGCRITKDFIDKTEEKIISRHQGALGGLRGFKNKGTDKLRASIGEDRIEIKIALSLLLLLNSRSKVLEIRPETSNKRKRKQKNGKLDNVAKLTPIGFDISRLLEKAKGKLTPEQAKKIQAESLVRGHFKLRKTGAFWWSFHLRNKRAALTQDKSTEYQLQRERSVKISKPESKLSLL